MQILTILMSSLAALYGLICFFIGTIWVGSKSYHGQTVVYNRYENPIMFHFWCVFFTLGGSTLAIVSYFVEF